MRKIVSVLLALCMMAGLLPVSAAEYVYGEPMEPELWMEPDFATDHAYSIAFVGDTQCLSRCDLQDGTKAMEELYGVIADTAVYRDIYAIIFDHVIARARFN